MKSFLVLIILSVIATGCEDLSGENTVTLAQLEAQYNEIEEFINQGTCSKDTECNYLPIGSKACGGPSGFIVFPENIDVEALKIMVKNYTENQRKYNKENNVISDCSIPNPPAKLGCIDNSCVEIL